MPPFTKELYNSLNNSFSDDQNIKDMIHYLKKDEMPNTVIPKMYQKKAKQYKVDPGDDDALIFIPLNLKVIPKSKTQDVLKDSYTNDDAGIGKGIVALYKYVRRHYMNITRKEVALFIKNQTNYQLTRDLKHRVNKPIISYYSNSLWCVDLIDMSSYEKENTHHRYIMTIVDVFSRKVWLEKLKTKDAISARDALKRAIDRAGISPNHLISDNGTEFLAEFAEYCKEQQIKQRFSRSYAPQANGIVERTNREVRKIIRAYFVKNGNRKWFHLLINVEENKNETYHSTIKTFPNEIWSPDKIKRTADARRIPNSLLESDPRNRSNPGKIVKFANGTFKTVNATDVQIDDLNRKTMQKIALNNVIKKVKSDIKRFKNTELEVGDFVRVKMVTISNSMRKMQKAGKEKLTWFLESIQGKK